jgi:hypothetical protein
MVLGFNCDICHARVEIFGADRMPHGLVLLARRQVTLVILVPTPARIQEERCECEAAGHRTITMAPDMLTCPRNTACQ